MEMEDSVSNLKHFIRGVSELFEEKNEKIHEYEVIEAVSHSEMDQIYRYWVSQMNGWTELLLG